MRHGDKVLTVVQPSGKVTLPASLRRQVGLENGGPVVISIEGGEFRILTVREAMSRLQADVGAVLRARGETVDQFLADRRLDAEREGDPA